MSPRARARYAAATPGCTTSAVPRFTRGYVTITDLVTPDDPAALNAWFDDLEAGLARYGGDEPRAVPEGGERRIAA